MDPGGTTAEVRFDLLGLPLELRDDIYEYVVFDLSPPEMVMLLRMTTTFAYRLMHTNILLTNRDIYWEVRDMIVRRGRLIMVSVMLPHNEAFTPRPVPVEILTGFAGIRAINPKYRNLCIMNHHSTCPIFPHLICSRCFNTFPETNTLKYTQSMCFLIGRAC